MKADNLNISNRLYLFLVSIERRRMNLKNNILISHKVLKSFVVKDNKKKYLTIKINKNCLFIDDKQLLSLCTNIENNVIMVIASTRHSAGRSFVQGQS